MASKKDTGQAHCRWDGWLVSATHPVFGRIWDILGWPFQICFFDLRTSEMQTTQHQKRIVYGVWGCCLGSSLVRVTRYMDCPGNSHSCFFRIVFFALVGFPSSTLCGSRRHFQWFSGSPGEVWSTHLRCLPTLTSLANRDPSQCRYWMQIHRAVASKTAHE